MKTIVSTLSEWKSLNPALPFAVLNRIEEILTTLDNLYGAERNGMIDDGGYVLLADSQEDLADLASIIDIDSPCFEYFTQIDDTYHEFLFLCHNEFGITVILPKRALPES